MKTLFTIGLLVVFGVISNFLVVFILNIAGLPGAFLAGRPGQRSRWQFILGSTVSAIGQSYVYLAYTAFIVSWTAGAAGRDDVVAFIAWPVAFLAVFFPIWLNLGRARAEANVMQHANVQTDALHLTFLVSLLAFIVFALLPVTMQPAWGWIPFVSE